MRTNQSETNVRQKRDLKNDLMLIYVFKDVFFKKVQQSFYLKKKSHIALVNKKKRQTADEKSLHTNCSSPRHMLNYLWACMGICLIFTMETNTLYSTSTHREQLPWHPAPWRQEAFSDHADQFSRRQLTGHSDNLLSITPHRLLLSTPPSLTLSPFFTMIFFLPPARRITFSSAEDKVLRCSV